MTKLNELAVELMRHACECSQHGYDQVLRWGNGTGECQVSANGLNYVIAKGDFDCSSIEVYIYKQLLVGTKYEGLLDKATYTGNMRSVFVASGLFEWKPMSFVAQPGDIYLNEADHTAMCISAEPDLLGEFSINENGGIAGGQAGDQTGYESYIHDYYNYPWDGILHYIGGDIEGLSSNVVVENVVLPTYRVKTKEDGWLDWMTGLVDTGGSSDDFAGVEGHAIVDFDCIDLGTNGWYTLTLEDGTELPKNTANATEQALSGVTIYYDTNTSETNGAYYKAKYRVAPVGQDYLKWEYDDEDDGAGGAGVIDRVQLTLEREQMALDTINIKLEITKLSTVFKPQLHERSLTFTRGESGRNVLIQLFDNNKRLNLEGMSDFVLKVQLPNGDAIVDSDNFVVTDAENGQLQYTVSANLTSFLGVCPNAYIQFTDTETGAVVTTQYIKIECTSDVDVSEEYYGGYTARYKELENQLSQLQEECDTLLENLEAQFNAKSATILSDAKTATANANTAATSANEKVAAAIAEQVGDAVSKEAEKQVGLTFVISDEDGGLDLIYTEEEEE